MQSTQPETPESPTPASRPDISADYPHHPPVDFLPGHEALQWGLVSPEEIPAAVAAIEPTFPIPDGQFAEILRLMEPAEVWVRSGTEIRFCWFNGNLRQSLCFLAYHPETERSEMNFVFCTEANGELLSCFRSATDKFWCQPSLGDCPPKIVLTENLPATPSVMTVLLVVCLRGKGDYSGFPSTVHTVWVG